MIPPARVEWIIDTTAADRLGLTVEQIHALIGSGELAGELARRPSPHFQERTYFWWVRATEVAYLAARREAEILAATETPDEEWALGYKIKPDPVVLYGLLTAADVTELERRLAKLAARQTDVIPITVMSRELATISP